MRTFECSDLQEALRSREPELLDALDVHAASCPRCREQHALWTAISDAAPSLRKEWETPRLWPHIRQALVREESSPRRLWSFRSASGGRSWVPAAAAAALFVVAAAGLWVFQAGSGGREPLVAGAWRYQDALMTEQALDDVQRRETDYLQSIERLSRLVEPRLRQAETPLVASYREKLLLLDGAITEIRTEIERNQYNTHLRRELLAMYDEKQRTLQDLMKEAQS